MVRADLAEGGELVVDDHVGGYVVWLKRGSEGIIVDGQAAR